MITISSYISDDEKRKATVFREQIDGKFYVSMTNEFGTSFQTNFQTEEAAEIYAGDWIMNK